MYGVIPKTFPMNQQRLRRIEEIFHAALQQSAERRIAWLNRMCGDDSDLRFQIERLLSRQSESHELENPIAEAAAEFLADHPRQSGTKFGPYEILDVAGTGGMGIVYRARDTRLDRLVAIKVLMPLRSDSAARGRFIREARLVSRLNHPHICTLHDVGMEGGTDYLVMEYLDGETLHHRLQRGILPLNTALQYAIQIADALQRAHNEGIIHRDLKPGNVMLTNSGAKLLDFGLAKLQRPIVGLTRLSNSETTNSITAEGFLVGTLHYISPEVLQGKDADVRSDIFAFGALLYEMLSGQKAFDGNTPPEITAAILERQPAKLSALNSQVPPALETLIERCLIKTPESRLPSMEVVINTLNSITAKPRVAGLRGTTISVKAIGFSLALVMLAVSALYFRLERPPASPLRFSFPIPDGDLPFVLALSPDGAQILFKGITDPGSNASLWLRSWESAEAKSIAGTKGARDFFWSHDGRQIGFFIDHKLQTLSLTGGPPQTLCECSAVTNFGASWSTSGTIVFGSRPGGLQKVSDKGGLPIPLTTVDEKRSEINHVWPQFLPDGRRFLYLAQSSRPENSAIFLGSLDSTDRKLILSSALIGRYTAGHLLFVRDSTLMAQRLNETTFDLEGSPQPLVEGVNVNVGNGMPAFTVSANGNLAYRTAAVTRSQLVWFNREGHQIQAIEPIGAYRHVVLSPLQQTHAAVTRSEPPAGEDIWIFDLVRGDQTRLTLDKGVDVNPVWSPDGTRIIFTSSRNTGVFDFYEKNLKTSDPEHRIFGNSIQKFLTDWSQDGHYLIYAAGTSTRDIWALPLTAGKEPFIVAPRSEGGKLSKNSRWIAFSSQESGRPEIYVQRFPESTGRLTVSTNGGIDPKWRQDGKELYFISLQNELMVVTVEETPSGELMRSVPRRLFQTRRHPLRQANFYDVSDDGQRFIINTVAGDPMAPPINVVLNWPALLKNQ